MRPAAALLVELGSAELEAWVAPLLEVPVAELVEEPVLDAEVAFYIVSF